MWLFVMFDLPTNTAEERKAASQFRKKLIKDGFGMMQYSIYVRHCASPQSADVHEKRVKKFLPSKGQVSILRITDKQYSGMANYIARKAENKPKAAKQLEMF